jgi:hypothetical protein
MVRHRQFHLRGILLAAAAAAPVVYYKYCLRMMLWLLQDRRTTRASSTRRATQSTALQNPEALVLHCSLTHSLAPIASSSRFPKPPGLLRLLANSCCSTCLSPRTAARFLTIVAVVVGAIAAVVLDTGAPFGHVIASRVSTSALCRGLSYSSSVSVDGGVRGAFDGNQQRFSVSCSGVLRVGILYGNRVVMNGTNLMLNLVRGFPVVAW